MRSPYWTNKGQPMEYILGAVVILAAVALLLQLPDVDTDSDGEAGE